MLQVWGNQDISTKHELAFQLPHAQKVIPHRSKDWFTKRTIQVEHRHQIVHQRVAKPDRLSDLLLHGC